MSESGEWEQRTPYWWVYRLTGHAPPCAHVLRQREEGPAGAWWDAILVGTDQGKDACLAERVSLDAAKAAVEREAGHRPWRLGQGPAGGDGHRPLDKGRGP